MAKLRRVSRKPLYIILSLSLLISIAYASFRYLYPVSNSGIYEINQSTISLEGRLIKDTSVGVEGNYFLIKSNGEAILLDNQGLDSFVGQTVQVDGFITPANTTGQPPTITVNSISLK